MRRVDTESEMEATEAVVTTVECSEEDWSESSRVW